MPRERGTAVERLGELFPAMDRTTITSVLEASENGQAAIDTLLKMHNPELNSPVLQIAAKSRWEAACPPSHETTLATRPQAPAPAPAATALDQPLSPVAAGIFNRLGALLKKNSKASSVSPRRNQGVQNLSRRRVQGFTQEPSGPEASTSASLPPTAGVSITEIITARASRERGEPVTTRGEPVTARGEPAAVRGEPVTARGEPVAVRGEPVTVRGEPVAVRGEPVTARERGSVGSGSCDDSGAEPRCSTARSSAAEEASQCCDMLVSNR